MLTMPVICGPSELPRLLIAFFVAVAASGVLVPTEAPAMAKRNSFPGMTFVMRLCSTSSLPTTCSIMIASVCAPSNQIRRMVILPVTGPVSRIAIGAAPVVLITVVLSTDGFSTLGSPVPVIVIGPGTITQREQLPKSNVPLSRTVPLTAR